MKVYEHGRYRQTNGLEMIATIDLVCKRNAVMIASPGWKSIHVRRHSQQTGILTKLSR
jgi:hypothetical protein